MSGRSRGLTLPGAARDGVCDISYLSFCSVSRMTLSLYSAEGNTRQAPWTAMVIPPSTAPKQWNMGTGMQMRTSDWIRHRCEARRQTEGRGLETRHTTRTHPPVILSSSTKQTGIVDDVKMRQRGGLWEPRGALEEREAVEGLNQ